MPFSIAGLLVFAYLGGKIPTSIAYNEKWEKQFFMCYVIPLTSYCITFFGFHLHIRESYISENVAIKVSPKD